MRNQYSWLLFQLDWGDRFYFMVDADSDSPDIHIKCKLLDYSDDDFTYKDLIWVVKLETGELSESYQISVGKLGRSVGVSK